MIDGKKIGRDARASLTLSGRWALPMDIPGTFFTFYLAD
jgi:hypothetical protein